MKVYNMTSARSGRPVANQYVISDVASYTFQSYDSTIANIDYVNLEITIYPAYDFSRTTAKYRNQFFEELCFHDLATKQGLENAIKNGYYEDFTVIMAR